MAAHQADRPRPRVSSRLKLSTGPKAKVTGASSRPGSSSEVFHITLTPSGTFMWVVNSGLRPCWRARGVHSRNHIISAPSPTPRVVLVRTGDAQVSANVRVASARQTSRLPRLGSAATRRRRGPPDRSPRLASCSLATVPIGLLDSPGPEPTPPALLPSHVDKPPRRKGATLVKLSDPSEGLSGSPLE